MRLEQREVGNFMLIKLLELRLDSTKIDTFKQIMTDFVERGKLFFLFDLTNLRYIDSRGLGALIAVKEWLDGKGEIVLCGANGAVGNFLRLARMNKIFRIFDNQEEAIENI